MEPLLGCATAYGRFSFRIKSRCRHPASSIPILSMEISSLYVFRLSSNHVSRQYYRHQPQYMLPGLRQDESTHCVPATEIQGHVEMAEGTNWRDSYRRIGFPTLSNDWCILRSREWVLSLIACLPQGDDPSVSSWHQNFFFGGLCIEFASYAGGREVHRCRWRFGGENVSEYEGPDIDHFWAIIFEQCFPSRQLSALNVTHDLPLLTYSLSHFLLRNAPPVTVLSCQ